MKLIELTASLSPQLSAQISAFEALFDYPLSENSRFSIDHGPDFTAFFTAIGDAKIWVLLSGDNVVAAISSAIKTVHIDGQNNRVAYIGDLKVHPRFQSRFPNAPGPEKMQAWPLEGRTNSTSAGTITQLIRSHLLHNSDWAYCVVMNGTRITPEAYTGNGRTPEFKPVADLYILRIETTVGAILSKSKTTSEKGYSTYKRLCSSAYCDLGKPELRSTIPTQWFISGESASGMLEDTRRAKRLYLNTDEELASAHLSYFSFETTTAAICVLEQALLSAQKQGFPGMFVALSKEQYRILSPHLARFNFSESGATIYATDPLGSRLLVNTSEI